MANETKKTSTSKTSTKKTTKSTKSNSSNKRTTKSSPRKNVSTKKKTTPKITNEELEKTVIIENIQNKIKDIVKAKEAEVVEDIKEEDKIENVAKLENAKYPIQKGSKNLLAIGVVISLLGIIALIITLVANRIVDKEFISDNAITMMVIASILIEIFGAFIIINES